VYGVGARKVEDLGEQVLEAIRAHARPPAPDGRL
jgi:hypothetical protein